jgi:hypothetical protein
MMRTSKDTTRCQPVPWSRPAGWKDVQRSIHFHLNRHLYIREALLPMAREIDAHLQLLARQMDVICANTCIHCPDPCCLTASVWYDFRDLLSLHLLETPIPIGQPAADYQGVCRFITHTGCSLPRMIRPWICTWYLCPVQSRWLKKQPGGYDRSLLKSLQRIKSLRAGLETQYIERVCR